MFSLCNPTRRPAPSIKLQACNITNELHESDSGSNSGGLWYGRFWIQVLFSEKSERERESSDKSNDCKCSAAPSDEGGASVDHEWVVHNDNDTDFFQVYIQWSYSIQSSCLREETRNDYWVLFLLLFFRELSAEIYAETNRYGKENKCIPLQQHSILCCWTDITA